MRYTLDRFEGNLAVLEAENRTTVTVATNLLPEGCTEGAVLLKTADGYVRNPQEETTRAACIKEKMKRLWK